MDKFKGAAKQAGEGARQVGEAAKDGMSPSTFGTAQDINRIGHQGVETKAILKSLTAVGGKKLGGGTEYAMEIEVHPEGGAPYPATITQQLIEQSADHYKQNIGGEVKVKVDPADPNKMVLWG
ncbi:MAG TPA: hypothetical protein VEY05_18390 [Beijerinckiaceae bacterium]|nr:hypothetical protein [Beijerinckiaceae bacterium]